MRAGRRASGLLILCWICASALAADAPIPQFVNAAELPGALPSRAEIKLYRIQDQPGLSVLHLPDAGAQGRMFARIAVLIERHGMPRDAIATPVAVAAHARRYGGGPTDVTAGNNLRGRDLARFFELARQQKTPLSPDELKLRDWLVAWGFIASIGGRWAVVEPERFLVTVPGLGDGIDAAIRAAILRHEIGHWRYFSDARYAAHCRDFWRTGLSADERTAITKRLVELGYDPRDEILIDEMQSYLLHTDVENGLLAPALGLDSARLADLNRRLKQRTAAQ